MSSFRLKMANSPISDVGIFDDFEDAKKMSSTVCQQVPMKEYEEDISCETDKALGDLCLYLDQHPEVYARILRKRKQEDLENSGLVSFVKSKMMKLVHGEDYPECLVSLSECMQQTTTLKVGMCKTFQYSQDIKGTSNRHSKRLAAKRNARIKQQMEKSDVKSFTSTPCVNASCDSQAEDSNSREQSLTSLKAGDTKTTSKVSVKSCSSPSSCHSSLSALSSSNSLTVKEMEGSCHGQNILNVGSIKGKQTRPKKEMLTPEGHQNDKSKACPSPPTAPPLPLCLTTTAQQSSWTVPRKTLSSLALNVESQNCLSQRRSPRIGKGGDGRKITPTSKQGSRDDLNLPPKKESPFLTPMVTRKKAHKRSSSISSVGSVTSVGSMGSVKSIHSEILSLNPISRLKVTQIARSPGGTPIRSQISGQLSSEPLHKALVTAMKTKFKNVYTPSPRSGNTSLNGSDTSGV